VCDIPRNWEFCYFIGLAGGKVWVDERIGEWLIQWGINKRWGIDISPHLALNPPELYNHHLHMHVVLPGVIRWEATPWD
jgi:hypothetical protein